MGTADYEALTPHAQAQQKRTIYELIFSPLVAGVSTGRISFTNNRMGEIWHTLNLEATPTMPTVLETIESMIGTTGSILVPIENPLDTNITLKSHVSNPDHFAVVPELIDLNGYEQGTFELQFRPSSLSEVTPLSSIVFISSYDL